MNTVPTRTHLPIVGSLIERMRAAYLRYLLDNCEQDAETHQMNEALARSRAQELRVELSRMGAL